MKTPPAMLALLLAASCSSTPENPPAPRFDEKGSDPRAIAIADEVVRASGGRAAWDATRCVQWSFFGKRTHLWDKWTGNYRLDENGRVVLMNLQSGEGRVFEGGSEVHDGDRRRKELARAGSIWINDAYWLFLPFKLKDSGVTLRWKGEEKLADGRAADVLDLTFTGVGDTPHNRYEVLVARDSHLVEGWRWFERADDSEPKLATPWTGYERYGAILLAAGRGEKREMQDIAVFDAPPEKLMRP